MNTTHTNEPTGQNVKQAVIQLGGEVLLRDYFAAKAMQGYISAKAWHPDFIYPEDFNFDAGQRAADAIAVASYKWADALLKARDA